jgi:hypothetical protein
VGGGSFLRGCKNVLATPALPKKIRLANDRNKNNFKRRNSNSNYLTTKQQQLERSRNNDNS